MIYFATTKCPKCGKIVQHYLEGPESYINPTTTCSYCDFAYVLIANCLDMNVVRDDPPIKSDSLAGFSTAELERELQGRKNL